MSCAEGDWAKDYPDPLGQLKDFPEFQELPSEGTKQRTKWNMRDAETILSIISKSSLESEGTNVGLKEGANLISLVIGRKLNYPKIISI